MLVLLVVSSVVLYSAGFSGGGGWARIVFMGLPAVLGVSYGRWKATLGYLVIAGGAFAVELIDLVGAWGAVGLVVSSFAGLVARVIPGFFLGYLAVVSIKVSELMAALEAWHTPRQFVIPLAVILRFLPTVHVSMAEVALSMTTRGLTLRRIGVSSWLEYRLVPLIISTVKSGEELSQAALTRGLGRPGKHTRIAKIGFGWLDALVGLAMIAAVAIWVVVP
jgi:energy-coupling factor transport system permease protein